MSEKRKYRQFTPEQKAEIVLAGLRGDRSVRDVCREYEIAETLYYQWRDRLLEGGKAAGDAAGSAAGGRGARRVAEEGRSAGAGAGSQDVRVGGRGGTLAGLAVSVRMARARAVVATGRTPAVVARVARVSRQALYRPPTRRPASAGPGRRRPGDDAIVEVAKSNPTDGTRMVAALTSRKLGTSVNRKRVQRVMREHHLLQRSRNGDRRRRPGYFRVTRPDELWPIDMTKVWTAQHGWIYLHAIVDCCTREVTGWSLDLRCRDDEALACVETALVDREVPAGRLTLGSDNGSQSTSRDFRRHLSARGVAHRRGGYHDPESQAFIESWFGQFKKRCAWRAEWESIEQARQEIGQYIDRYHDRPHSGLGYRIPLEVAATWRPDPDVPHTTAT